MMLFASANGPCRFSFPTEGSFMSEGGAPRQAYATNG